MVKKPAIHTDKEKTLLKVAYLTANVTHNPFLRIPAKIESRFL